MAFLLGPPVMVGALLGAAVWLELQGVAAPAAAGAPWATPERSANLPQDGTPVVEAPVARLPPIGPDGKIKGLEPGWEGIIFAARVEPMEVNILPGPPIRRYQPKPGPADMTQIIAAGPANSLFAGVQIGFLRVPRAGRYSVTLRLQRSSYQTVNCVMRLALNARRVLSQYNIGVSGETNVIFEPVTFDMQPGLYKVAMAFGCWHDGEMAGPGLLTLMVRHPGDAAPVPVREDEILQPAARPP